MFQACWSLGRLYAKGREVEFRGYKYECHLKNGKIVVVDSEDVKTVKPLHTEKLHQINCPSVIFQIFKSKGTALYNRVKSVTNNLNGVQTQCIDFSKFSSQRNQEQYASAIATKLNTKLSKEAWNSGIQWGEFEC